MEYLLDKRDYHKQLSPIINTINDTPSLRDNGLVIDILDRVNRLFTQHVDPKTKQEAISLLDDSLNDIFNFMNYPSIRDTESYVRDYIDDFQAIQCSELYPIDDDDTQDLANMYDAGIKTVLAQFISFLEYSL